MAGDIPHALSPSLEELLFGQRFRRLAGHNANVTSVPMREECQSGRES